MKLCLKIIFALNFIIAVDLGGGVHILEILDRNSFSSSSDDGLSSHSRDDSSTVWIEDFEGDVSGWSVEDGWELTKLQSNP